MLNSATPGDTLIDLIPIPRCANWYLLLGYRKYFIADTGLDPWVRARPANDWNEFAAQFSLTEMILEHAASSTDPCEPTIWSLVGKSAFSNCNLIAVATKKIVKMPDFSFLATMAALKCIKFQVYCSYSEEFFGNISEIIGELETQCND